MTYVIPKPDQPSVAVQGTQDRFPIRRVYCVGRNYAAHAREMGNNPDKEPPFFFAKPADAVIDADQPVPYPPNTNELHFEVELVVALGSGGANLSVESARNCIWGAAVGIDLTRRGVQAIAKSMGRPWDLAKGFDHSAIVGPLHPVDDPTVLSAGSIWLDRNHERQQTGDLSEMIWPVAEHIAFLSGDVALCAGDLIMTGTPSGVGAVAVGDTLQASVDGLGEINVRIV